MHPWLCPLISDACWLKRAACVWTVPCFRCGADISWSSVHHRVPVNVIKRRALSRLARFIQLPTTPKSSISSIRGLPQICVWHFGICEQGPTCGAHMGSCFGNHDVNAAYDIQVWPVSVGPDAEKKRATTCGFHVHRCLRRKRPQPNLFGSPNEMHGWPKRTHVPLGVAISPIQRSGNGCCLRRETRR